MDSDKPALHGKTEKRKGYFGMTASTPIWVFLVYCLYCGILFFLQRQILFPRDLTDAPPSFRDDIPGLERIWLETADGNVETWYIPPAPESELPAPAMIFAHGNAELIDFWPDDFMAFTRMGMGVLLVEYPGYGRSQGRPSQKSIARTFAAAYDMLVRRSDIDSARIVLAGRSIGGGAVCQLAAIRPCAALILMSAFTGTRPFAKNYLVPGFLVRDPFDNLAVVKKYAGPVLIMHGERDEVIGFEHGRKLREAALHGTMITYPCGHNDFPPHQPTFEADVSGFLRQAGILRAD
ncbi:MAG: alpha/beta hydrolase [Desulfobacterales bacterium]